MDYVFKYLGDVRYNKLIKAVICLVNFSISFIIYYLGNYGVNQIMWFIANETTHLKILYSIIIIRRIHLFFSLLTMLHWLKV